MKRWAPTATVRPLLTVLVGALGSLPRLLVGGPLLAALARADEALR